jgi:hypothetical protein
MLKERKIELIQRSLGIKHKLKVYESMKSPDTHEDLAVTLLSKWELEDELHAIEQLLAESRHKNVQERKRLISEENIPLIRERYESIADSDDSEPPKPAKSRTKK